MTVATLVLLALTAALSVLPLSRRPWIPPTAATIALLAAAVTATATTPATGFARAAAETLTVITAAVGGAAVVRIVFRIAHRQHDASPDADTEPLRGGLVIGILERIAVTGSILAGWPEGIAIVLAVKGLARYPELRETHSASEQFIIGTFASVLWAVAVCGVGVAVVT